MDTRKNVNSGKLSITAPCNDHNDAFSKCFCLSIVHAGRNKNLSSESVTESYQTARKGMKDFQELKNDVHVPSNVKD